MGLFNRLADIPETGQPAEETAKIGRDVFCGALVEVLRGNRTDAQVQSYFSMSADDITEWDQLMVLIDAKVGVEAKEAFISEMWWVLCLVEDGVPGLATAAQLYSRLQQI